MKGPVDATGHEPDDVWQFTGGHPVKDLGPLRMKYDIPGQPLDYSHGGLDVPIVHARVAEVFTRMAPQDVQFLPVQYLHIDRSRVGDEQLFRLQDWEVVIIVSEELKDALERSQATGMTFTEVP